jgi:hypothetical protein
MAMEENVVLTSVKLGDTLYVPETMDALNSGGPWGIKFCPFSDLSLLCLIDL